jgi:hypothetical protein
VGRLTAPARCGTPGPPLGPSGGLIAGLHRQKGAGRRASGSRRRGQCRGRGRPGETAEGAVHCGGSSLVGPRATGCRPGLPSDPGPLTRPPRRAHSTSARRVTGRVGSGAVHGSPRAPSRTHVMLRARATVRSSWAGQRTGPRPAVGAAGSISRPGPGAVSAKPQVGAPAGLWPVPLAGLGRTGRRGRDPDCGRAREVL